ncbi:MAG TPA: LPXTG cell wall anchor domain-containing protein, partial [Roseiflexaceae bacterium]|nr:LPXTG cell wall anchor domain-containing protein [Roseiflexaceae bacterium]
GNLDVGATFSQTFNTAGTFAYFCKYHGAKGGTGMAGTITVAAAAQPEPTAAPAEPTAAPAEPTAAPTAAAAPAAPSGSVEASDQAIAGGSITVAKVTAGQDGWIVAHLDEGGKPGKVIGHSAVKAGDNANVAIALSEDVPAGGKLWPMLHIDAGTIGTYEFPGPDAPVIVGGNIVMKQIAVIAAESGGTQAAPADALQAADQPLVDGGITVASVTASVDGWIAVHLDEGGKPGKVIGFGPVKAGQNSNVTLKLSENVPAGGKLWPMLHVDAGTIGTYEFPGPDAPVIVNGSIIMQQITITAAGGGQTGGQTGAARPPSLPRTGGEDAPFGLMLGALALLMSGGLLALRARRRA